MEGHKRLVRRSSARRVAFDLQGGARLACKCPLRAICGGRLDPLLPGIPNPREGETARCSIAFPCDMHGTEDSCQSRTHGDRLRKRSWS